MLDRGMATVGVSGSQKPGSHLNLDSQTQIHLDREVQATLKRKLRMDTLRNLWAELQ